MKRAWGSIRGENVRTRILLLSAAGAFVWVVLLIHHELMNYLERQDRFTIDPGAGGLAVRPEWADESGAERGPGPVVSDVHTTLDEGAVRKIGDALKENVWIRRVNSVERIYPQTVRVRFEFREPEVAVQTSQGIILLDADFLRLPGLYPELPVPLARPRLAGVSGATPGPGKRWNLPAIQAGKSLATLCSEHPILRSLEIQEIDVSDRNGGPRAVTRQGCRIYWGRMSGPGELSVERKMENLSRILAYYPHLEGLASVRVYVEGTPTVELRETTRARGR